MLLDYDTINTALKAVEAPLTASELHGQLCGQLAMETEIDVQGWINPYLKTLDTAEKDIEDFAQVLHDFCADVKRQVVSDDYELELLLPDDDVLLAERTDALALWCQGFLSGLGMAGLQKDDLTDTVVEILEDLTEISQVVYEEGMDEEEGEEGNEFAYIELVEYVRMAVYSLRDQEINKME